MFQLWCFCLLTLSDFPFLSLLFLRGSFSELFLLVWSISLSFTNMWSISQFSNRFFPSTLAVCINHLYTIWLVLSLQQLKTTEDLVSDTDRNIHVMFEALKRKKKAKVESLMLNRNSFAQTIENLFALSFLVKDGRAHIYVEETGAQVVGIISCQKFLPWFLFYFSFIFLFFIFL